jgi:hypothetical protein
MLESKRNQIGLTQRQIEFCLQAWELLCEGSIQRKLVISEATQHVISQVKVTDTIPKKG